MFRLVGGGCALADATRAVVGEALGGPELTFLQTRLARQRGDLDGARKPVQDCLQDLPGHWGFADFGAEIGADLPSGARELAERGWEQPASS